MRRNNIFYYAARYELLSFGLKFQYFSQIGIEKKCCMQVSNICPSISFAFRFYNNAWYRLNACSYIPKKNMLMLWFWV